MFAAISSKLLNAKSYLADPASIFTIPFAGFASVCSAIQSYDILGLQQGGSLFKNCFASCFVMPDVINKNDRFI
jgi:hypothetical protein